MRYRICRRLHNQIVLFPFRLFYLILDHPCLGFSAVKHHELAGWWLLFRGSYIWHVF